VPELDNYDNLLVVDALITDKQETYRVKLSRTISSSTEFPSPVTGALVSVFDEMGTEYFFLEKESGEYYSDSTVFQAEVGKAYALRIITKEGEHYESEYERMISVPDINKLYYRIEEEVIESENREYRGLGFYIDTKDESGECRYYRWEFAEDWEFSTPFPKMVEYFRSDSIEVIPVENHHCWKKAYSTDIRILSTAENPFQEITGFKVDFKSPALSDRFNIKYSLLMRQYSMSEEQYNFWDDVQSVSEETGDIFEQQPVSIRSNIMNVNDTDERIIGYFQVSAVSEKRIFIELSELQNRDLEFQRSSCKTIRYPQDADPGVTFNSFDNAYNYYSQIYVLYTVVIGPSGGLTELWFTTRRCSDCRLSGDPNPPAFWEMQKNRAND
jgi:hypothetical protein